MDARSHFHARRAWWLTILVALSTTLSLLSLSPDSLMVRPSQAAFPGDNGRIAFVEFPNVLKAVDPDGSNEQTLTSDGKSPAWSPDGEKIAYMAPGSGGATIYIAEADGSNPQSVTIGDDPAWSPDGKKIVFRGPGCVLWIHDLTSGLDTQLTTLDPEASNECHFSPNWKPNGNQIVFTRMIYWQVAYIKYDLWMINENGTGLTQLTDVGVGNNEPDPGDDLDPNWSPDGAKIVFSRGVPGIGIYTISAGGGSPSWLAATGNVRPYPAWSPEGEQIAYVYYNRTPDPHIYEIHIMDDDGSNDQTILSTEEQVIQLDWGVETGKEFVVNSEDSLGDNDVGDGDCDTGELLGNGDVECTLLAAVEEANFDSAKDTITFDIPGEGMPRIRTHLDGWTFEVTYPVEIDATTQPGSGRVEIVGPYEKCVENFLECTCDYDSTPYLCFGGFKITGGDTTLRGLIIYGMTTWAVYLSGEGGNVLEGNYIGVDPSGMSAMGNGRIYFEEGEDFGWGGGGILIESGGNRIGGLDHPRGICSGGCNLISGNTLVDSPGPEVIQLPTGISIRGPAATGNMIYGNFIGVDLNGQQVPSGLVQYEGIYVGENPAGEDAGAENVIESNVIAGNIDNAIYIEDGGNNTIQDNLIGTNASGSGKINSYQDTGALIADSESNEVIGNVVSDFTFGIYIVGVDAAANSIRQNMIGTTADGMYALRNEKGIYIAGDPGGAGPTLTDVVSNTIAFNDTGLFQIDGSTTSTIEENSIHDNEIGIHVLDASNNEINDNSIFNNELGVWVETTSVGEHANDIRISSNSIHGNRNWTRSGLGIDLAPEGFTLNDLSDSDDGPNTLLNFPVLGFAMVSPEGDLRIGGSFNSILGSHPYRIELFANQMCDESGYGEGERFLGFVEATTDLTGRAVIDYTKTQAGVGLGQFLTATAIDENGNTSEFSRCVEAQPGDGLSANASAGSTSIQMYSTQGILAGDLIRINPGGNNQEDNMVTGFGSLLLATPLQFDHVTGEPVVVISERIYLPVTKK